MLEKYVDTFVQQYNLITANSKVLIGVSGGPDSMALLHYLLARRDSWQLDLVVVTIDHGLRGEESEQDVDYVKAYCNQHRVPVENHYVDVKSFKQQHKCGTQEAARTLRYQVFSRLMVKHQAKYLALAHHSDDQTETVYMRITRGSQPEALAGIKQSRPFASGYIVRPFLSITKEMIEHYLEENGITPRRDPSNQEDTYTRNYFRLHILPHLKQVNPNLNQSIRYLTDNIEKDSDYLNEQAKLVSDSVLNYQNSPKQVTCSIIELKKHHPALQRRVFHLILNYLYDNLPSGLHYRHDQQFFDLLDSDRANMAIDLPKRLKMIKHYESLTIGFEQSASPYCYALNIPGVTAIPSDKNMIAEIIYNPTTLSSDQYTFYIPLKDNQVPAFYVRTRLPGDRIYLAGINGRKKLKSIFIDKKIPLHKREEWPILVDQYGEVFWVIGLIKKSFNQDLSSGQYIKLTYQPQKML